MLIHNGYDSLSFRLPVVTLGIFDGVHRGHRSLLESLNEKARSTGGESVVVTFSPHPRQVLEGGAARLSLLTTMDEKTELLSQAGVDHLVIIEFTESFSRIEACDFLKDILAAKVGTKHLLLGYNHRFGRQGDGDFMTVSECAEPLGFTVEQVQQFHTEEGMISSSAIREAISGGRLDEGNRWLGYKYRLSGRVVQGKRIGRELGYPTANITPYDSNKLIPANGVYAVEVISGGSRHTGMMSIGTNPTIDPLNTARSLEVHIFGFESDIYGEELTLVFHKRLRDEMRFENKARLAEQMAADMENARRYFGE